VTRVLFCVLPEKGHIHPYIGPAQALVERGVDVAFCAPADISEPLARAGLRVVGERRPQPSHTRGAEFAERVRDRAWLRRFIKTMLLDGVDSGITPIAATIAEFRPDVVVIDPMSYAAAIAAERVSLPWAAVSNSLNPVLPALPADFDSELLSTVRWLADERASLFARYGLAPSFAGCDLISPHLTIAFATDALVGRRVPGVELVGPSLPRGARGDEAPFDWSWRDKSTLVYMSLGSQIYHQPRWFERVIDALARLPVQGLLAVGDLSFTLPPNLRAVPYAPQLEALRRAGAFITHGGANSVMEALAAGVPMLLAPLCNDQFHQGAFVSAAGVGRVVDLGSADIAASLASLEALRPRVAEVAASYATDGATRAAELILKLAAKIRPAPAS
jgi:UDP:flavonoid glycosyltransferase YjiC (YdhE family)